MRISAIQSYNPRRFSCSSKSNVRKIETEPPQDNINFKGKKVAGGMGIGALVGLGALTILSGGAAAPIAYAAYAATMGAAGGMLGHAIEETEKDRKNNK